MSQPFPFPVCRFAVFLLFVCFAVERIFVSRSDIALDSSQFSTQIVG